MHNITISPSVSGQIAYPDALLDTVKYVLNTINRLRITFQSVMIKLIPGFEPLPIYQSSNYLTTDRAMLSVDYLIEEFNMTIRHLVYYLPTRGYDSALAQELLNAMILTDPVDQFQWTYKYLRYLPTGTWGITTDNETGLFDSKTVVISEEAEKGLVSIESVSVPAQTSVAVRMAYARMHNYAAVIVAKNAILRANLMVLGIDITSAPLAPSYAPPMFMPVTQDEIDFLFMGGQDLAYAYYGVYDTPARLCSGSTNFLGLL